MPVTPAREAPTTTPARELPPYTIVASSYTTWMKNAPNAMMPWTSTTRSGTRFSNMDIDQALQRGARVLRVGIDDSAGR